MVQVDIDLSFSALVKCFIRILNKKKSIVYIQTNIGMQLNGEHVLKMVNLYYMVNL